MAIAKSPAMLGLAVSCRTLLSMDTRRSTTGWRRVPVGDDGLAWLSSLLAGISLCLPLQAWLCQPLEGFAVLTLAAPGPAPAPRGACAAPRRGAWEWVGLAGRKLDAMLVDAGLVTMTSSTFLTYQRDRFMAANRRHHTCSAASSTAAHSTAP